MKLTKTSAQATLAMAFLAGQKDERWVQARQIASHLEIPTDSALKILQALTRQGLIQSQLGRCGGYQVQRNPADITLLEIIEAIDGPITAQMPLTSARQRLSAGADQLTKVYEYAARQLRAELSRATLASLVPVAGRRLDPLPFDPIETRTLSASV